MEMGTAPLWAVEPLIGVFIAGFLVRIAVSFRLSRNLLHASGVGSIRAVGCR